MRSREASKEKILEAAVQVFDLRGFQGATVREICDRAGVNVAAVNYHFGDKAALYELAFSQTVKAAQSRIGMPFDILDTVGDPRAVLRRFLVQMALKGLTGNFEPPNFRLVGWEILSPTGSIQKMLTRELGPKVDRVEALIADMLETTPGTPAARARAVWVLGQAIHFARFGPLLIGERRDRLGDNDALAMAETLAEQTLAGLAGTFAGPSTV